MTTGACTIRARIANAHANAAEATVAVRVRAAAVARFSVTADRSMIEVGEQVALRATTFDAMDVEMKDAAPAWRSLQPVVARIEGDGRVTAVSPGRATLVAELDGKSGQITLLVSPAAVESLSVTAPSTEIEVGTPMRLTIVARDRNGQPASPALRWVIDPAGAATVSAIGDVTATRAGPFTVLASLNVPTDATGILSARSPIESSVTIIAHARVSVAAPPSTRNKPMLVGGGSIAAIALAWMLWPSSVPSTNTATAEAPAISTPSIVAPTSTPAKADSTKPADVPAATPPQLGERRDTLPKGTPPASTPPASKPTAASKLPALPPTSARPNDSRADARAATRGATTAASVPSTPTTTSSSPAYQAPAATPPAAPINDAPPASPPASAASATEAASAAELRTIADRVAADVRSGKLRPSDDLKQFFADGAEHKVSVSSSPAVASLAQGQMRTQFDLSLSRFNSGGALERRSVVVRIEVTKRAGVLDVATAFGPVVKAGSR